MLICTATLLLKLLVPSGYMIDSDGGRIAITICSGTVPSPAAREMPRAHGAMPDHGKSEDHGKAQMPCAFSGLSAAALGSVDPVQLAAFIAFIMAIGLAGARLLPPQEAAYLRPPLRGPPASL